MTTPWEVPRAAETRAVRDLIVATDDLRTAIARHYGMGGSDLSALSHLAAVGPITPTDLAPALRLTGASVTSVVDRLEADGLVSRRPHPDDRRRMLLELTPRAHERVVALRIALGEVVAGITDPDTVVPVLDHLSDRLHDVAARLPALLPPSS